MKRSGDARSSSGGASSDLDSGYVENVGIEKEDVESVFREAKLFFEGQSREHKERELVQWEPTTNTGTRSTERKC